MQTADIDEDEAQARVDRVRVPHRVTKTYDNLPCAHRAHQPEAGNCQFVHGYSRSFTLVFEADAYCPHTGWLIDFGDLRWIKQRLEQWYDHTFVVAADDPLLPAFRELEEAGAMRLTVQDHAGMEGTSEIVWRFVNETLRRQYDGHVWCVSVEARENNKNAATFSHVPTWAGENHGKPRP